MDYNYSNYTISTWWLLLLTITLLSLSSRLISLGKPEFVCWDEFHFAKMSSWYLEGKVFFDVHPPLGKMILAGCCLQTAHQKSFSFESPYMPYDEHYPYIYIRSFCSILSSFVPGLCFCITWNLTKSLRASLISSLLVCFDTALLLIGRLILLDSILMFFILSSLFCFTESQKIKLMSCKRNLWLLVCGMCLGWAISVKLVAVFMMVFYALQISYEIWSLLPDRSILFIDLLKRCGIYLLFLVKVPISMYLLFFLAHFSLLTKSGTGDSMFSAAFQSEIEQNFFNDIVQAKYVSYDGEVVIRNVHNQGYLNHVEDKNCHRNSELLTSQSVFGADYFWTFKPFFNSNVSFVADGNIVQLQHLNSMKMLNILQSSTALPQRYLTAVCLNESQSEMLEEDEKSQFFKIQIDIKTTPGFDLVEAIHKYDSSDKTYLEPLKHTFHLIDIDSECFLQSSNVKLNNRWHEKVLCGYNENHHSSRWFIERSVDKRVEQVKRKIKPLNFWQKFLEIHILMFKANNALEAKDDETHSTPLQWFLNAKGHPISGPDYVMYLLGNPASYWSSSLIIILFLLTQISIAVIKCRTSSPVVSEETKSSINACWFFLIGWFAHFVPFFLMCRPLYFHHYLSAAIFKFMLAGAALNCFVELFFNLFVTNLITVAYLAVIVQSFLIFSPLAYGVNITSPGSEKFLQKIRWMESWEF